jgi:hypothetical protein
VPSTTRCQSWSRAPHSREDRKRVRVGHVCGRGWCRRARGLSVRVGYRSWRARPRMPRHLSHAPLSSSGASGRMGECRSVTAGRDRILKKPEQLAGLGALEFSAHGRPDRDRPARHSAGRWLTSGGSWHERGPTRESPEEQCGYERLFGLRKSASTEATLAMSRTPTTVPARMFMI